MAQGDLVTAAGAQALDVPALEFGPVRCRVGRIYCQLKPGGVIRAELSGECQISPRIKEPLFRLATGERIVITTRRNVTRDDSGGLTWQRHVEVEALRATAAAGGWPNVIRERAAEWERRLFFRAQQVNGDGSVDPTQEGLRPAQVGALHAIGAHWSLYRHPATVVMPTGTGKTETMLATLAGFIRRGPLLVTVPSAILRDQTADKFRTFGLLRKLGVITEDAPNPIVGVVMRRPRSLEDLEFFERCNVIVGTMSALAEGDAIPFTPEIATRIDTLIVDEAHHIGADKWSQFREAFAERRILQFTATPFRRDGKLVDGTVIYNYPLKMAQRDGYFKPIEFVPVHESGSSADLAIAKTAVKRLKDDLNAGLNHLMMARCVSIDRARTVHAVYCNLAPDLNPLLIHSHLTDTDDRLAALRRGDHRIAVCVNMLGEGFDLPELKVAAVHDLHKSLAILLQFTGRFTRSAAENIGDAAIVANIADANVSDALERLYGEDADWNEVLSELSSEAARQHAELIEFLDSTERLDSRDDDDVAISHHLLRPTLSTLIYRAEDFQPKQFHEGLPRRMIPHRVWFHSASDTLFFVTRAEPTLKWTRAKDVRNREWDLFVLHYDRERGLLFLSSTDHSTRYASLAEAVGAGLIVEGDVIFRTLGRVNRLIFQNVGLKKRGRRNLGYAMYTGSDVAEALSIAERGASEKNNVSGTGWENGHHVAIGCSAKGRVWSRESGPIPRFVNWCDTVGDKLLDTSIRTENIIRNVLIPKPITELPDAEILNVEWPAEILRYLEEKVVFTNGTREESLFSFDLELTGVDRNRNSITFDLVHANEGVWSSYALSIGGADLYGVTRVSGPQLRVKVAKVEAPLEDYFQDYPPLVRFVDLQELDGNSLIGPQDPRTLTIDDERFESWPWTGVDIRKESLWKDGAERQDSIQGYVASRYIDAGFNIVFDDDASGEAADLICLKEEGDHIRLVLVHCKFASGQSPGERVKDVVEVCSQAVRCAKWNGRFPQLCHHIRNRNEALASEGRADRFIAGTLRELTRLQKLSRVKAVRPEVLVAQPGLSRARRSDEQTAVIAAAATYLKETISVDLDIICSE